MTKVTFTDKNGDKHEAEVVANGSEGEFKLICTNSGDELAKGNEELDHGVRIVMIYSADPIFEDQAFAGEFNDIANEIEAQFNGEAA